MFKTQILQVESEGIFFGNQKEIVIKLQSIKNTSIYAD